ISVVTADGRVILGILRGFDQTTNIIMERCYERVFSADEGVEVVPLGLYVVRGDNVVLVGEVDTEVDSVIDYPNIKAEPLRPLHH
ncbi:hypothetical protein BDF19DRAFT_381706, partial [Syncephalis fuscata]